MPNRPPTAGSFHSPTIHLLAQTVPVGGPRTACFI